MLSGRLTVVFRPTKGRVLRYERSGAVISLVDGALSFLLRLLARARK